MKKRRVYFNEFNVMMEKVAYLPFASGLLRANAEKSKIIKSNYEFTPFLFLRDDIEKIVPCYKNPSVAAFSVYMWNEQLSLRIAERVKKLFPDCLIVFGGAQVPHDAKNYFKSYPFIDIAVRGDGEEVFSQILERFIDSTDFSGIYNISWRNPQDASCIQNETRIPNIENLDVFPSPYLEGVFDYLFKDVNDIKYQAIIETNRGCPFNCSYCVWGKGGLNKKLHYHSIERVAAEIEWCGEHKIRYLFNADSNFGIHRRDKDIARILINTKKKYGFPEKFRSCFTKNSGDRIYELAKLLFKGNLDKGITLSFQSMNEKVIQNVRRQNIKLSTYKDLLTKFNKENIPVYTELILGLPGENFFSWIKGINSVIEAGLRGQLFIYPCEAYPNTELADRGYQDRFGIVTKRILLTETHGSIRQKSEIAEYQDIIITTNSMSVDDWRKMMIFSWVTMFLFSLKAGFFALLYLFYRFGIKFTDLIEFICKNRLPERCSLLRDELTTYYRHLDHILEGGGRCTAMPAFNKLYWDMEESTFLRISGHLDSFYEQLLVLIKYFLKEKDIIYNDAELAEAVQYQRMRIPSFNPPKVQKFKFKFNFPEYFESCNNQSIRLIEQAQTMSIFPKDYGGDMARYAQEIVLWGRKSNKMLSEARWSKS